VNKGNEAVSEAAVWSCLRTVYDPCCADRGISVVDMGVADKVLINEAGKVTVELVLTTGWCPFVNSLEIEIPQRLREAFGDIDVQVKSKWDPVWTLDRMSPEARQKMAMPLEKLLPIREARIRKEVEAQRRREPIA
jgi:metal-sulfur cluster biosynthetic enzyme